MGNEVEGGGYGVGGGGGNKVAALPRSGRRLGVGERVRTLQREPPLQCHLRAAAHISMQISDSRSSNSPSLPILLSQSLADVPFPGELIFNYLNVGMNK